MRGKGTTPSAPQQPVFHKVAENLYRVESSGEYYALVRRGGKQFRCSLKTKDRKLADSRLKDIKGQVGILAVSEDATLGFEVVANRWSRPRLVKRSMLTVVTPEYVAASARLN